jgi:hypothetical protein
MKSSKGQKASFTQPILKDLIERQKAEQKQQLSQTLNEIPSVDSTPSGQPALYQDPGSGYNANFVFPQD